MHEGVDGDTLHRFGGMLADVEVYVCLAERSIPSVALLVLVINTKGCKCAQVSRMCFLQLSWFTAMVFVVGVELNVWSVYQACIEMWIYLLLPCHGV